MNKYELAAVISGKLEEDEKEQELVRHFTGVANTFGAKVCVEGIETTGMRDILQNYNVQSFQGYYYSKPLPGEEYLEFLKERSERTETNSKPEKTIY
mgnify:CR=1 FL=1